MRPRDIRLSHFRNRCNGNTQPRLWIGTTPDGAKMYASFGPEWFPVNAEGQDLSRDLAQQTSDGIWLAWQYEARSRKVKEAR